MTVGEARAEHLEVDGRTVRITNPDRVLWPATGTTKRELIAYYQRIAPVLLPHVRGRGITLGRWPAGVEGTGWLQAECRGRPPWVPVHVVTTRRGGTFGYCMVEDRAALAWVTNLGTIELHPFLARSESPGEPTAVVVDLDPGPPAGLVEASRVAVEVAERLDRVGLPSFAKTSGMLGIHVYAPLAPGSSFDETKAFARSLAAELTAVPALQVTDVMARAARVGRVYVDWLQNDPSRSTVAAWSARAASRPTVSTPVTWTELDTAARTGDVSGLVFGFEAAIERAARDGDLFAPVLHPSRTARLPAAA